MTAVLRIIGYIWLALAATGIVVTYGVLWIWQSVAAATASPPSDAPIGTFAAIAIAIPGLVLIGLAAWLDRRRWR
jgi:hypothetical protein